MFFMPAKRVRAASFGISTTLKDDRVTRAGKDFIALLQECGGNGRGHRVPNGTRAEFFVQLTKLPADRSISNLVRAERVARSHGVCVTLSRENGYYRFYKSGSAGGFVRGGGFAGGSGRRG